MKPVIAMYAYAPTGTPISGIYSIVPATIMVVEDTYDRDPEEGITVDKFGESKAHWGLQEERPDGKGRRFICEDGQVHPESEIILTEEFIPSDILRELCSWGLEYDEERSTGKRIYFKKELSYQTSPSSFRSVVTMFAGIDLFANESRGSENGSVEDEEYDFEKQAVVRTGLSGPEKLRIRTSIDSPSYQAVEEAMASAARLLFRNRHLRTGNNLTDTARRLQYLTNIDQFVAVQAPGEDTPKEDALEDTVPRRVDEAA